MQDFRKDEIIYDEGFLNQEFLNPGKEYVIEKKEDKEQHEEPEYESIKKNKAKKAKPHAQVLISIQLVVCVLIALALFLVKMFSFDTYATIRSWYDTQMNKTLISQSAFDENLLTNFLNSALYNNLAENNATDDEVPSEKN